MLSFLCNEWKGSVTNMYPLPITTALYMHIPILYIKPLGLLLIRTSCPSQSPSIIKDMRGFRTFFRGWGVSDRYLSLPGGLLGIFFGNLIIQVLKKMNFARRSGRAWPPPPLPRSAHEGTLLGTLCLYLDSTPSKTSLRRARVDVTLMKSKYQQSSEPAFHCEEKSSP